MTTLTASPASATRENRVLADRLGGTIAREIALVAAGTVAMIVLARISIPLPFTPVPVSLGTLGAVAASDAFFPFADGLQVLIDAGVKAVVQPGGSVRDQESIDAANAAGITMYLTGTRHFAH